MENVHMKKTYLSAAILMSFLLSGCGGKTADEHFISATELASQQRYNEAIIELKSAVTEAPENANYRVLLGKMYMQSGDFVSAEKELFRALQNGHSINDIAIDLAQSSYRSGNFNALTRLIEEHTDINAANLRYISFYQALANVQEGVGAPGLADFDKLIDAPEPDLNLYTQAILQIRTNSLQNILPILDNIAKDAPIAIDVLLLKAQTHAMLQQTDASISSLKDYIRLVPVDLQNRLSLAQLYLQQQNIDEAEKQLNTLLTAVPDHGFTNYLQAIVNYEKKNFTKAKELIDKALTNRFSNTQSRLLAGIIHYELGLNALALDHFSSIKTELDAYPQAKRMLAILQLQSGEYNLAGTTLENSALTEEDITLASATIFQLLRQGNNTQANSLISKIEDAGLNNTSEALSALGQLKLGLPGKTDEAVADLEQALLLDPNRQDARATLASSYIRQQQFDKALALGEDWIKTNENNAAGYNLKALVNLLTDKPDNAAADIEQALKVDATNVLSQYLMATLQQNQGKIEDALATLQKITASQPTYEPALIATYRLKKTLEQDVLAFINDVKAIYQKTPDNLALLSLVTSMLQQEKLPDDIISLLEPLAKTAQRQPAFVYAGLGNAYLLKQDWANALVMTEQWFNVNPKNPAAALAYANLLAINGKSQEALNTIEQLIKDYPNDHNLTLFKFDLLGQQQKYREALAYHNTLPQEVRDNARVQAQAGRYHLALGERNLALAKLTESYKQNPIQPTLLALAEAMQGAKPLSEIVALIEKHQVDHGANTDVSMYLANMLIETDIDKAITLYSETLKQEADNPYLLNNYAWILAEKGELEQALIYVKKALTLSSEHPDIIDTYGKVLSLNKQYSEAQAQFKKSLTIRPNHPEVVLNYAEVLIADRKLDEARVLLEGFKPDSTQHQEKLKSLLAAL